MTEVVIDFSFAHAEVTPAKLAQIPGVTGFIAYAGSYGGDKNITKAELHALLDAGLHGCLVIEDNAGDLVRGAPVGADQGRRVVAAAKALGYDWENAVLATGYDTDAHGGDYSHLLEAMEAYAREVPHPGYYGDSDSIDYLAARHPDWFFWQSSSGSFSPKNPTENAHLWQQFNHPLAHHAGLASAVDINFVRRTPLGFMGEGTDPLSGITPEQIAEAVWAHRVRMNHNEHSRRMDWGIVQAYESSQDARQAARSADAKADSVLKIVGDAKSGILARVAALQKSAADAATANASLEAAVTNLAAVVNALTPAAVDVSALAAAVVAGVKNLTWKASE
jgi:hypothetical protein